jgi:hypothetical protein
MGNKKFETLNTDQIENGTPEDRIIIIKSIFNKEAKLKLQPTKSRVNGRYQGIETNVSEMEKMKRGYLPEVSSSIIIKDGLTFDLNDAQDKADWDWVKHSRHIAKDFEAAQKSGLGEAWFYVYRPGAASRKKLKEMNRELELLNKINSDTETNLYNRVRLMGIDMTDQPISDVKEYLMTAAKDRKRTNSIWELYESSDISLKLMLYHGMDNNVIKFDGFAYKYGNILLGTTEDLALEYLSNPLNVAIVKEIENGIYPKKGEGKEAPVKTDPLAMARAAKAAKKEK